jgi:diaminopimelate epimerase
MKKAPAKQGTPFHKLHGAGNDLLVVHSSDLPKRNKSAFVRRMAHRQTGIGCDQVVELLSTRPLAVQIWNKDGSQAEMCANGSRSFLFLAALEGWLEAKAETVPLEVSGAPYLGRKVKGGYELCLGSPKILGADQLALAGESVPFWEVSTGNPHAVVLLHEGKHHWAAPRAFNFLEYGPRMETHARFPRRTNVEFVHPWKRKGKEVVVKVEAWERGAGPTLSCGSGAVAVAAVLRELTGAERFRVQMTQFELQVKFEGDQAYLSGPCALVAKGWYFD